METLRYNSRENILTYRARDDIIWKPHNQNVASKPGVIYAHGR